MLWVVLRQFILLAVGPSSWGVRRSGSSARISITPGHIKSITALGRFYWLAVWAKPVLSLRPGLANTGRQRPLWLLVSAQRERGMLELRAAGGRGLMYTA